MAKSVTIVAMGGSSRVINDGVFSGDDALRLAVRKTLGGEVWAINAMGALINADRVIMMDDLSALMDRSDWGPEIWERLKNLRVPLVTSTPHPEFPTSEAYPLQKVLDIGIPYLTSTPAYAIALAIAEGFEEIRLYGVDYAYDVQPFHDAAVGAADALHRAVESRDGLAVADATRAWSKAVADLSRMSQNKESGRACVEWWVGFAMAHGIAIDMPWCTTLLDNNKGGQLYGYARQPQQATDAFLRAVAAAQTQDGETCAQPS